MARQIQLRRGTADQHETFTGAEGEVTFDITNKTLRAHDGSTPGGIALARKDDVPNMDTADYVIASQEPTAANGLTWYRKYKSGWVEQGGHIFGSSSVTFPIPMKNNDYVWRINSLKNLYAPNKIGAIYFISEFYSVYIVGMQPQNPEPHQYQSAVFWFHTNTDYDQFDTTPVPTFRDA